MNFNYNEFKNGRIAITKIGKAVKFACDLRDGNMVLLTVCAQGLSVFKCIL